MPSTQDLLNAITQMQQTAQANVPVISNNGNPNGANNMPAMTALPPVTSAVPWMQPSPYMENIQQMLAAHPANNILDMSSTPASPIVTNHSNISPIMQGGGNRMPVLPFYSPMSKVITPPSIMPVLPQGTY